jgi:hypothetical protein
MNRPFNALPSDEGGMDHTHIDEADLRARYVLHRLSTDEEERFEAHLLACAACQDAVESELELRDSLQDLSASDAVGALTTRPSLERRIWAPVLAVAASALLVVSTALAFQLRRISVQRDAATAAAVDAQHRRSVAEQSAASLAARLAQSARQAAAADPASSDRGAPAAVFALTMTRAAGAENNGAGPTRIRVAGAKWIVLTVDLARPASSAQFVVTLSDAESHAAVWSGGPFEAAAPETLTLALDATLFHPGDFVLRLERRLAGGRSTLEGQYSLRVTAPGR